MKVLFLSDLHLGSPLFESEDVIMSLLDKDYDRVFIVGDVLDVWQDDVVSIATKYKDLFMKINDLENVVIIKGNHDPSLAELQNFFPLKEVVTEYDFHDEKSMIIIHGDEFDWLVTKYSWLAKILFPIHWVFSRVGLNLKGFFRSLFYSLSAKRDKDYYNDLVLNVEIELVKKYKAAFDCIIVGHSHFPKKVEGDGFIYVNCGDWTYNRSYVEYENGEFRLIEL